MGALDTYRAKRDFSKTSEPEAAGSPSQLALRYSIQKHDATRLHFDLRLEWEGVLLSWAITRGPSLRPSEKRLAVRTEDHPLSYLSYEGTIPEKNYGAGTVMLWDMGHWQPLDDVKKGLKKGHLHFALHGNRLTGGWNLVRMNREGQKENWLLLKEDDEAAGQRDPVRRYTRSVGTRRTMKDIASGAEAGKAPDRTGAAPRWRQPQLATLTDELGDPKRRWHELKFDGYRAMVAIGTAGARIFTRSGLDWTEKFQPLVPSFEELPCDTAMIDGEIVVGAGMYGFGLLQKAIKLGGPFTFQAFDLLQLDGKSLADRPLHERRKQLENLFRDAPPLGLLQLSPVIEGDPSAAFQAICRSGGEGLISKLTDAPYKGGRSRAWEKIKCTRRNEFVVVGWQKSDKAGRPFASLALAVHSEGALTYAGKVGTGFDDDTMTELEQRMKPLRRKTPPVEVARSETRGMVWLTPTLVVEASYADFTEEGRLRHAVFLGLRSDKPADEVALDDPVAAVRDDDDSSDPVVAGTRITSAERVVFPDAGITKLELAEYYDRMAGAMLEVAARRPLSLVRMPEGIAGQRFFQKHAGKGFPSAIKPVEITESDGESSEYMQVTDARGVVAAVQMGTIEFHIWGSRVDQLERPDRMVFDLDPDEGLGFAKVREAARDLRSRLSELGLESWPMLTGGKGIHVVVQLKRTAGWKTVSLFARSLATLCATEDPGRYTANIRKARRSGRIFIDWLRNERGATAVAPFSVRAKPAATVAVPVDWDELDDFESADHFDIRSATGRDWSSVKVPSPAGLTQQVISRLESRFR